MRGTNGPMDVVTRAEFEDTMNDFPTKDDLKRGLAETRTELVSTVREAINDLKVDLFAEIEEKVTRSHNLLELGAVKSSDLKDAKNEILATHRRNVGEAVAPLKADLDAMKADLTGVKSDVASVKSDLTSVKSDLASVKSDMASVKSDMEIGFLKMGSRLDDMEHKIRTVVMDGHHGLEENLERFSQEVRQTLKHHEERLDRHDADFYKLRQSGVLS